MEQTAAEGARDLSIVSLVLNADPVVQAVMAGLVLASLACWAIIFEKVIRLRRLGGDVRRLRTAAATGDVPDKSNRGLVKAVLLAAAHENAEKDYRPCISRLPPRARRCLRFLSRTCRHRNRRPNGVLDLCDFGVGRLVVGERGRAAKTHAKRGKHDLFHLFVLSVV